MREDVSLDRRDGTTGYEQALTVRVPFRLPTPAPFLGRHTAPSLPVCTNRHASAAHFFICIPRTAHLDLFQLVLNAREPGVEL